LTAAAPAPPLPSMMASFVPASLRPSAAPSAQAPSVGLGSTRAGPSQGERTTLLAALPAAVGCAAVFARAERPRRWARRAAAGTPGDMGLAVRPTQSSGGSTGGTLSNWQADPERIGATLPLANPSEGVMMWDPLGFCSDGTEETFDKFREAEVKHGRVAMMATIGFITQHYVHIPGFETGSEVIGMADMPNGIGALTTEPGGQGMAYLVLISGIFELGVLKSPAGSKPWQFGDPWDCRKLIVDCKDETVESYQIEHGRLAMLCFLGIVTAEYVTGYDAVDQWAYWAVGLSKWNAFLNA